MKKTIRRMSVLALAMLSLFSESVDATGDIVHATLKNGMRVVIVRMPSHLSLPRRSIIWLAATKRLRVSRAWPTRRSI